MDERNWTDRPLGLGEALELEACRVERHAVPFLSLVSGDLDAALAAIAPGARLIGLGERPGDDTFGIRIARDHAALVTTGAPEIGDGWHDGGFALSRADDRFALLSLTGTGAATRLATGLASPLPERSPSAAIRFAGRTVMLTGCDGGFGLWVELGELTYVTGFLRGSLANSAP